MADHVPSSPFSWRKEQTDNARPRIDVNDARPTNRLAQIMEEFAEETGVFGLNLLRPRLTLLETAFWILCTAFFACCTVRDLTNVTIAFMGQETLSLTSQINSASFVLDPTFSFSHNLAKFEFRRIPTDEKLDQMLDSMFATFKNKTERFSMEPEVFQLTLIMLHNMISNELLVLFPTAKFGNESGPLEWAGQYREKSNFALIRSSIERVYKRFRAENVSFSNLAKFVVSEVCSTMAFSIEFHDESFHEETRSSPCTPSNVLGFHTYTMTFRLSNSSLTFVDPSDFVQISWNAFSADSNSLTGEHIVVDLNGKTQTGWERESTLLDVSYSKAGERIVASIGASEVFVRAEEKTSSPCSKTITRYDCKQRCYIDRFIRQCHCSSIYFAIAYETAAGKVEECPYTRRNENTSGHLIDYLIDCEKVNASVKKTADERCWTNCLPDCRSQTFDTTVERDKQPNGTRNELRLRIQSFTFPLVEEKLKLSFDDFISQFGGILGLYIGLSFAALVHIPLFVVRKVVEHFRELPHSGKADSSENVCEMSSQERTNRLNCGNDNLLEQILQRLEAVDRRLDAVERRFETSEGRRS